MGLLPAKKKLKKSYDIDSYYLNLASTITNRKNVTVQKHNEILEKRICEDNANFLNPRELEISIYNPITNQQLEPKLINNFLKMQDFTNKNWYNEYKINKYGKGAYLLIKYSQYQVELIFTSSISVPVIYSSSGVLHGILPFSER